MKTIFHIIIAIACVIVISTGGPAFAKPVRVAIIPFKINAEKDLSYLKRGIYDMLSSRLSDRESVVIISKQTTAKVIKSFLAESDHTSVRKLGGKLNADYVLYGSINVFGTSMSIDSAIVHITGKKPRVSIYREIRKIEDIIPEMSLFAQKINQKLFSNKTGDEPLPRGKSKSDKTKDFFKTQDFEAHIKGLAIGDVDGDKNIETVFISKGIVHIYRLQYNTFSKLAEINCKKHQKLLTVDVADIRKDGCAEIFITSINSLSDQLNSFVLEWDGEQFKTIAENQKWYFRVLSIPDQEPILAGQKQGVSDLFLPGIYKMQHQAGKYVQDTKISLPRGTTVFNFTIGNIINNNTRSVITFDNKERISVFSASGELEWKSSESFGGTENSVKAPSKQPDFFYIPQRLLITNLDNDHNYELTVVKHSSTPGRMFQKFRLFSNARISSLAWDKIGMSEQQTTTEIPAHISDYAVGDINNDGRKEIAASVVSKREYPIRKPKSSIIIWDHAAN